jgi:hypothetical protein
LHCQFYVFCVLAALVLFLGIIAVSVKPIDIFPPIDIAVVIFRLQRRLGGGDSEFTKWHVRSYRLGLYCRTASRSSRMTGHRRSRTKGFQAAQPQAGPERIR